MLLGLRLDECRLRALWTWHFRRGTCDSFLTGTFFWMTRAHDFFPRTPIAVSPVESAALKAYSGIKRDHPRRARAREKKTFFVALDASSGGEKGVWG